MCGILAEYHFDASARIDEPRFRSMADTMIHRGPDDAGYWVDGRIGLAHRRLSIIDLSADGRQPMPNEDESVLLTFNGEIYNFQSLRDDLVRRGHRFRSHSDSEVILHAYEEWGCLGCLERLRGMFAFVVWDKKRKRLFAARDRLGIKPVYYRHGDDSLIIASEVKAILGHPEVEGAVDLDGILEHFTYRFTLPPRTAFAGVSKLPAGHFMIAEEGQVEIQEYWRPPGVEVEEEPERSTGEWVEALREKLLETVRGHMIADVPVGAFLSGGLDSGSLVAMATELSDESVRTYTAGFESGWHDESAKAREVAEFHHTDHHEHTTQPSTEQDLKKIVWHLEEPLINTSIIPLYSVAQLASRDVKVVLAGEGSDEINGGYARYSMIDDLLQRRRIRHSVPGLDGLLNRASRMLPDSRLGTRLQRMNRITHATTGEFIALSSTALGAGETRESSPFNQDVVDRISALSQRIEDELLDGYRDLREARQKFFIYDMRGWLANELLIRADKITMAHSLEGRVPFLDHELVELCLRIPSELKVTGGKTKAVLRDAMRNALPPETTGRKQHGFVVPIADWLRQDWREMLRDVTRDSKARSRGIFDMERVDAMLDEHLSGRRDWTGPLYGFLLTEYWHQAFTDG